MRRVLIVILLLAPCFASAQRMEVYTYKGFKYIANFAYGLPREVVKTNSEMKEAQFNGDGTGVMKRHYTYKGVNERIGDDGYNGNEKITFGFLVAPYNVDIDGNHTSTDMLSWSEASGWDTATDNVSGEYIGTDKIGVGVSKLPEKATGCAAYKGLNGADNEGEWRLPTQREIQVMFTVIEQALTYINKGEVEQEIQEGVFWTSTELITTGDKCEAWSINSVTGFPNYDLKSEKRYARCIKDIYDTINE